MALREVTREGLQISLRSLDADNHVETELDVDGLAPADGSPPSPAAGPKP